MAAKNWWLFSIVGALGVVAYMGRNQLASVMIDNEDALANSNVQAFLAMIRKFESNGRYDVIYGGQRFADFSKHPNVRIPFTNPKTGKSDYSTAAGAYQFNYPTWNYVLSLAGSGDFSPASQDNACVWLLKVIGALEPIMQGDFETGIRLASQRWASLPYTDSMQNHVSLAAAKAVYLENGGTA